MGSIYLTSKEQRNIPIEQELVQIYEAYKLRARVVEQNAVFLKDFFTKKIKHPAHPLHSELKHALKIINCGIDQSNKLFEKAFESNQIRVMKTVFGYNLRIEYRMIDNAIKKLFQTDKNKVVMDIFFYAWMKKIDEDTMKLQDRFESLCREKKYQSKLWDQPDYILVPELISNLEKLHSTHVNSFEFASDEDNESSMNLILTSELPKELSILDELSSTIENLYENVSKD